MVVPGCGHRRPPAESRAGTTPPTPADPSRCHVANPWRVPTGRGRVGSSTGWPRGRKRTRIAPDDDHHKTTARSVCWPHHARCSCRHGSRPSSSRLTLAGSPPVGTPRPSRRPSQSGRETGLLHGGVREQLRHLAVVREGLCLHPSQRRLKSPVTRSWSRRTGRTPCWARAATFLSSAPESPRPHEGHRSADGRADGGKELLGTGWSSSPWSAQ